MLSDAEHVVEADLFLSSGCVVIAGCTEDFRRIQAVPGLYRVCMSYEPADGKADGFGHHLLYRVHLWPAVTAVGLVLRQGPISWVS